MADVDDKRHYINIYPDFSPETSKNIVDLQTNTIHDNFKEKLISRIKIMLQKMEQCKKFWNHDNDYSLYTGLPGIAFMFYHYGNYLNEPTYTEKSAVIIQRILSKFKSKRSVTFLTGIAGPLALGAVIQHLHFDEKKSKLLIIKLESLFSQVVDDSSELPDELLYGKVGYLYALLFVNSHISPPPIQDELIKEIIASVIKSGKSYSAATRCESPIMYSWHDSEYLGGAHGLAGIIYILLQARKYLSEQDLSDYIKPALAYLLKLKYASGNFPSSVGSRTDKLVHWCHGAPSMTMLFTLAYEVFGDEEYLRTAIQCGEVVWARGFLKKGCGICHGVAGNAYTFLCLFQITEDPKHLYRACKFAEWCMDYQTHQTTPSDRPFSLFEGMAGTIYFMVDILKPEIAKFPGYTL